MAHHEIAKLQFETIDPDTSVRSVEAVIRNLTFVFPILLENS